MKFIRRLSEEDSDMLEAAQYVTNSYKSIIENILTKDIKVSDNRFSEYVNDYIDRYVYEAYTKNEITKKYLPNIEKEMYWMINYATRIIKVNLPNNEPDEKDINAFLKKGFVVEDET